MRLLIFFVLVCGFLLSGTPRLVAEDDFGIKVKTPDGIDIELKKGDPPPPASPVVVERVRVVEKTPVQTKTSNCSCRICHKENK